jgi:UDP-N-acetylglucosamine 2-epimerase (non-hydrolysing)
LLLVQGDTSSALGAALAGFAAGVAVGHVEAGLRTHDPKLPWPEEGYRTRIDAHAQLLFAPTETAAHNVNAEGVGGRLWITGNTGIDALLFEVAQMPARRLAQRGKPRLLVTCHRRESWADGLEQVAAAVAAIAAVGMAEVDCILHPNAFVAANMRDLLSGAPHVRLLQPMAYRDLIAAMRDADLILSDSGGIQEEAPALGIPLLVLRDKTERPEGVATGNMRLVGTEAGRIVAEVRALLHQPAALAAMARPAFPYGDGHAAPRIAAAIENWLTHRQEAAKRRTDAAADW